MPVDQPIDAKAWQRLKPLLRHALDLDGTRRVEFLASLNESDADLLPDLQRLLARSRTEGPVDDPLGAIRKASTLVDAALAEDTRIGQVLGCYRLERPLGTGGMGTVYLAERIDAGFVQKVALKIVEGRAISHDQRTRFERERQILASLRHPNIASLFDGGETPDGLPYYTMELVEGSNLVEYCRDSRATVSECIRLVLQVAAALAYAHQNLVVHRDVKPSNILVTSDGHVKLLDFGIAKLLGDSADAAITRVPIGPMTPEYAAPEQFTGGPITVATDTYQLGVVTFRILTGSLPYRADPSDQLAWAHAVRYEDMLSLNQALEIDVAGKHPPSSALRGVSRARRADLEAILRKALAKLPEEGYRSMDAMIADLEAFQEQRAVSARKPSTLYYLWRFVSRRPYVTAGSVVAVFALIGSSIFAQRQARLASDEAERSRATTAFVTSLFRVSDPAVNRGERLNANQILDRGAERAEKELAAQPEQRARMLALIGNVYSDMGDDSRAAPLLDRAIYTLRGMANVDRAELGEALIDRAWVEIAQGNPKKAREFLGEAEPYLDAVGHASQKSYQHYFDELAMSLWQLGEYSAALEKYYTALRLSERFGRPSNATRSNISNLLRDLGDYEGARKEAQLALDTALQSLGESNPQTIGARSNLATILTYLEDLDGAQAQLEIAISQCYRLFGEKNVRCAVPEDNLGEVARQQGRYDEALEHFSKAEAAYRSAFGDENVAVARPLFYAGQVEYSRGNLLASLRLHEQALAIRRNGLAGDHPEVAESLDAKGLTVLGLGRYAEAKENFEEALRIRRAKLPMYHEAVALSLLHLGLAQHAIGDTATASQAFREAQLLAPRAFLGRKRALAEFEAMVAHPEKTISPSKGG